MNLEFKPYNEMLKKEFFDILPLNRKNIEEIC